MSTSDKIDWTTLDIADVIAPNTGVTITSGNGFRIGNCIWLNAVFGLSTAIGTSQVTLGTINEGFRSKNVYNGGCFLSTRQWSSQAAGYLYIAQSGGILTVDDSDSGYTWAKISVFYEI